MKRVQFYRGVNKLSAVDILLTQNLILLGIDCFIESWFLFK